MKQLYFLVAALLFTSVVAAQTTPGGVRIGTAGSPHAAAVLDLDAQGKGLLIPRMDSVTRTGISAPPDGLMVFQTNGRSGFWYAMRGAWLFIPDKARSGNGGAGDNLGNHTATQNLNLSGNKLVGGSTTRADRGGLSLDGNGLLMVGATRVHPDSTTGYGVRLLDQDQDFILTSKALRGKINPLNVSAAGDRMMWLSYYSAFRAGGVSGNRWDYNHIGRYSAAFGYDNEVLGDYSAAFGYNNWVRFGAYNLLTGYNNYGLLCEGGFMTGRNNSMRGLNGLAGGFESKVYSSTSLYVPSLAFGYRSQARSSASSSYALGYYARSGGYEGCFVLADFSPYRTSYADDSLVSTARNQFSARFAGGYRLFTTTATNDRNNGTVQTPVGVQLTPGGNAWAVLSDSTKKERVVLADGHRFLERLNRLRLGSWNYRGQDPRTMRHYGPMAQDFYAAFGHDALGTIGNDTTINQADFDGVNLIALQALYRQVLDLKAENAQLRQQVRQTQQRAEASTATLEQRLRRLEGLLEPHAQR
jgi:hypothetical protein